MGVFSLARYRPGLDGEPVTPAARRQLLRRALGAGALLWLVEVSAGTVGFLWPAAGGGSGRIRVGTYAELLARQGNLPIADGFPAYIPEAHAFVAIVDPTRFSSRTFKMLISRKGPRCGH